jgi:hypothetical protein
MKESKVIFAYCFSMLEVIRLCLQSTRERASGFSVSDDSARGMEFLYYYLLSIYKENTHKKRGQLSTSQLMMVQHEKNCRSFLSLPMDWIKPKSISRYCPFKGKDT